MNYLSPLQQYRLKYHPTLPSTLQNLKSIEFIEEPSQIMEEEVRKAFPLSVAYPFLLFRKGKEFSGKALKVGVVFSGGQAPGGHNVIAGLLDGLKQLHPDSQLIGFLDGPSGLIKNKFIPLNEKTVAPYRNQGGFDLIGSGRTKIESPEQFEAVKKTLLSHQLDGLVIIGGDDSNTNSAFLTEYCLREKIKTSIIGVPKTIDGDLKNEYIEISFGFDTASKIYSEIIGNLLKDVLSAKKYYFFVKMMGRSSSHLTLECALQTHVNLALIGEEVAQNQMSLKEIVHSIANLICERAAKGKNYGLILIPEGLIEFIPECQQMILELNKILVEESDPDKIKEKLSSKSLECFLLFPEPFQKQLLLDRDSHGNIQLSKIETERLLIALVEYELQSRVDQYVGKFNPQPLFCGYEGRSGLPSNFDSTYCYSLGHLAALLISHQATGYMCCITNLSEPVEKWELRGVPLVDMLHFELRNNKRQAVIQKSYVNLESRPFQIFKKERDLWRLNDFYLCPGPIQFEGPKELIDRPAETLLLETDPIKSM